MELNGNTILEFLKGVDSIWKLLSAVLLIIVIGTIFLYVKEKETFYQIINRITGAETQKELKKISEKISNQQLIHVKQVLKNKNNISILKEELNEVKSDSKQILNELKYVTNYIKEQDKTIIFNNDIKNFIESFIMKKGLSESEFGLFLTSIGIESTNYFNNIIRYGLKSYNTDAINDEMVGKYNQVIALINCSNIQNCEKIKTQIKNKIIHRNILKFINDFHVKQSHLENGKLLQEFEKICIKFISNTVVQSYSLYKEYK